MEFSDIIKAIAPDAMYLLAFFFIALFSYRLVLHPLRAYPGPLAAKLTNAHNGYHSMKKQLHLVTRQDHLRYGPVMRYGPNKLIFNTAQALHDIYDNQRVVKSRVYTVSAQTPGVYSSFNVIDQRAHRTKRRITGETLNEHSMQVFEPTMQDQVELFIKLLLLSSRDASSVNMTVRLEYLACDIISLLAFGYPLKLQTDPSNRWFIKGMYLGNYFTYTRMQFFRIHQLKLSAILHFISRSMRARYKQFMDNIITTRISEDTHIRHDLYSVAAKHNAEAVNTGESIRLSELWAEAAAFFPAGAFSTSCGISALFFYLSRNPRCYEKLADELRTTFTNGADIRNGLQLSGCKYLRACIDETLRISPPIPGTLWREAQADGKDESLIIDGHVIPPGTQFGVNAYALHHNEEYFPQPYVFRPERWLEAPKDQMRRMLKAFSPFSVGYRGCPGKALAYLESSLVIAKTLWYFDFKIAPGKVGEIGGGTPGRTDGRGRSGEYQLYDILSGSHDGPYLAFNPRQHYCEELSTEGLTLQ